MTVEDMQALCPGDIVSNRGGSDKYRVLSNDGGVVAVERVFEAGEAAQWAIMRKAAVDE